MVRSRSERQPVEGSDDLAGQQGRSLEAGREYGVPLPATAVVYQVFEALMARGRGGWDHASLLTLLEDLSRHEIT
jgi:3-hydroxyisobutyrate dehydrogenase-like beta-hydroxyacid dehydrogenase